MVDSQAETRQEQQPKTVTSSSNNKCRSLLHLNNSKYRDFSKGYENDEDSFPIDFIIPRLQQQQQQTINIVTIDALLNLPSKQNITTFHKTLAGTDISSLHCKSAAEFGRFCDRMGIDKSPLYKVTTSVGDTKFESISVLSLDRRTLTDQSNDSDLEEGTTPTQQLQSTVERNAKVIKWLSNIKKAN
ncbi:unnamed protein product [Didymodactylos carnosus]|uniref:Centrosome-associated FAM110 C-terminal domain-containing protein n=1 Tax=Didymodactylos carnosus TaxID=1234261 RepID=A0A814K508_9BILA|nr:unnamed protein product [Didymodactylos carnosus]CAF1046285.1 unnamed protein product [Didymodactylos carnosus]CAF3806339.1 unnamed protein product [Didymodactylos carnosus]CAF3816129.1 unnamed protein product [Didymodactylos carnosus]